MFRFEIHDFFKKFDLELNTESRCFESSAFYVVREGFFARVEGV